MAEGPHTGTPIKRKDGKGSYVVSEKLGEGGEGEVYAVADSFQWVIKVYKPGKAPKGTATKKLLVMEGLMPPLAGEHAGHPSLTWPEQIIRDRNSNSLVGFVMPRVDMSGTMTVGEFFAPSVRQQKLQAMNLQLDGVQIQQTRWNIIRNLSKTVARVHEQGHLVGDINDRNILVEPTRGDVSIIDCDSFQVRDQKTRTIYRCKVGRPEYTAPELLQQMQGPCRRAQCPGGSDRHDTGYPCVSRNQEHDKFGMAVIIFQLLMEGNHPYDCRVIGPDAGASTRWEKIKQGYYPYSTSRPAHIRVNNPINQTRFERLPKNVRDMFERAFARV